jgi:hypothetical protein
MPYSLAPNGGLPGDWSTAEVWGPCTDCRGVGDCDAMAGRPNVAARGRGMVESDTGVKPGAMAIRYLRTQFFFDGMFTLLVREVCESRKLEL